MTTAQRVRHLLHELASARTDAELRRMTVRLGIDPALPPKLYQAALQRKLVALAAYGPYTTPLPPRFRYTLN